MNATRLVGIVLIVLGVLGLAYGGFSYTKDTKAVKLGPIELSVKEKETVNVPTWAGVVATNWWAANHAGVEALLRSAGLRVVGRAGHEMYLCRPDAQMAQVQELYASQFAAATGQMRRAA